MTTNTAIDTAIDTIDTTESVLQSMMTENTGRHMLDSGGNGGRNWERNQNINFEETPETTFSMAYGEIDLTVNVYHWLKARLDYDSEMTERFTAFSADSDEPWLYDMETFVDMLEDESEITERYLCNSYNNESLLSQIIQFIQWTDEYNDTYILLQLHNGCDARGGYTRPYAFKVSDDYFAADFCTGGVYCDGTYDCEASWNTYDGHTWDANGNLWDELERLEDYKTVCANDLEETEVAEYMATPDKRKGIVFVDDDGNGYCPECGGKLTGSTH